MVTVRNLVVVVLVSGVAAEPLPSTRSNPAAGINPQSVATV
jgi:hypothetical protein